MCGQSWLDSCHDSDSDRADRVAPTQQFETTCSSGGQQPNGTTQDGKFRALKKKVSMKLKRWDPVKMAYLRTSFIFGLSVLITWIPSSANRFYSLSHHGQVSYRLSIASGCVLPLQGVWNAIIFFTTSWSAVQAEARSLKAKFGYGGGEYPRGTRLESRLGISSVETYDSFKVRCHGPGGCGCGNCEMQDLQLDGRSGRRTPSPGSTSPA
jgi:hypothetical protein